MSSDTRLAALNLRFFNDLFPLLTVAHESSILHDH